MLKHSKSQMKFITEKQLNNFFDKVIKDANIKGCWLWTGATKKNKVNPNEKEYGQVSINDKTKRVHHVSFIIANNLFIDKKLFLCHTCDIRNCVNPKHLFEGDHKINSDDMRAKDRERKATGNKCKGRRFYKGMKAFNPFPKGHEPNQRINKEIAYQVKHLLKNKFTAPQILEKISCSELTLDIVYSIKSNKTWREA